MEGVMYPIDSITYKSTNGFNHRVRFLVMHYTAVNFKGSISALTGPSVSAHYLIPDPSDKTYIDAGFKEMRIFQLVDENQRAWHAGLSSWAGRTNLNDTAIGIEMVNLARDDKGGFYFPPYDLVQIDAIKKLAINILKRFPDITPVNVVGHSDIAIGRKSDPGASFPWKSLYEAGVGAWYEEFLFQRYLTQFSKSVPIKKDIIAKLRTYGYDISNAGVESGYKSLIRAFQLHFRQNNYDGIVDAETAAILYALVDKYFPAA